MNKIQTLNLPKYRGAHAFKETEEFIVALSGSFDVVLHDGIKEHRFTLNRSYYGVLVPKMVWRVLENFSTNSLALIAASSEYSAADYIREYDEKGASIGAGSVVTKDIPNNTLWYGNPAKQMGYVCNCSHNLDDAFECRACKSKYRMEHNTIIRSD